MNEKILNYMNLVATFDDTVYSIMIDTYGKENVDNFIMMVLCNKGIYTNIYKKILAKSDSKCYMVANGIYMNRLTEIVDKLDNIFISLGYDDKKFLNKLMYLKVEYVLNNISSVSVTREIKELYQEFLTIRNKIFESNTGLIDSKLLERMGNNMTDLYQEASFGLLRAIEKYDSKLGSFSTYASIKINYAILEHIHDMESFVYMPYVVKSKYYMLLKMVNDYYSKYNRYPTDEEISSKLGISEEEIKIYKNIYLYDIYNRDSLDDIIVSDEEDLSLIDTLFDGSENPVLDTIMEEDLHDIMSDVIQELSTREKWVIDEHYMNGKGIREMARERNVTPSYISSLHKMALRKVRRKQERFIDYY